MTPLEAVARAIAKAHFERLKRLGHPTAQTEGDTAERYSERCWGLWCDEARAALEVRSGPSEAIVPAAETSIDPFSGAMWPMGHGVVMTATGAAGPNGLLLFVGVPDDLTGAPGGVAERSTWNEIVAGDGPKMAISFANIEAVDRMISELNQVKVEITAALGEQL